MIKTNCALFRYDYYTRRGGCIGLTELVCDHSDACKFFKTREQVEEEQKKCKQRIERLLAEGVRVPNVN